MVASNIADTRFAIQSAKGTPVATSAFGIYLAGGEQIHPMRGEDSFAETSATRMRSDRYVTEVHAQGAPQFYVMPKSVGALLYGVLGGKSVVGASDPYTHTIVPASATPWFTFWRMVGNLIFERFTDVKIKSIVLHGESGRPLTITANLLGLASAFKSAAETTAAIEIAQRFMHYDGSGALMVEGAAVASINNFDLTIENNSQTIAGDSISPQDVSEGELQVTLRANQLFTSTALRNRLYYGSATPADNAAVVNALLELGGSGIDFLFTRVGAAPGPERSLRIQIPRASVQPFDIQPTTGNDPLRADITYNALQPASGAAITAIVKNGQATY